MISWLAVFVAMAFVPLGERCRRVIEHRGGLPRWLRTWWVGLLTVTLVIVVVGVPAIHGNLALAPVYGAALGIAAPWPRRRPACG